MTTVLDRIVEAKRHEVERHKVEMPLSELERRIAGMLAPFNFSGALWGDSVRLIAEVKKASPSKGLLRADFDPVQLAATYAEHGAAAISVLTDIHFEGALEHLQAVKEALRSHGLPILRKDFAIDPYQVYEARAYGADALLLIVAILSQQELERLLSLAQRVWLQCLVEVHNEEELQRAVSAGAEVIGINNRDLRTFHTDLGVTERLAPRVPKGKVIVGESGISSWSDVVRLHRSGVQAILVGEALVTSRDIAAKMAELLGISANAPRSRSQTPL